MNDPSIAAVRAFNRFYTRQIGLLDEHVAKTRFTLAEGRVLYEIGLKHPTNAAEIAKELGLDAAYLSRLLKTLAGMKLIETTPSATDRRRSDIRITAEGQAAIVEIDRMNDAAVEAVLSDVPAEGRLALVAAMASIRALLGGRAARGPVIVRPQRLGDIGWLIHRQGLAYNLQFGWNGDFEALIAGIYSEYHAAPAEPPKSIWVAEQEGAIAGSIFVQPSAGIADSAQLRMLFVEPAARGQGIGGVLVAQAVSFARQSGYDRVRLWTHANQLAARKLYAGAGFAIVETMAETNFGKQLIGEIWEMRF
jgi:DNA-binding MarR family transcriptional regulator/GNAT superfamily N-acetyltransferase